jgi:peptidoglycan/LPS O-acetylase OafA/YrhL
MSDFVLVALLALTIFGASMSERYFARLLGSRPLVWFGEASYSIYMVHFPVLIVMRRVWERAGFETWGNLGKIAAFLAAVILVLMIAAMLFYLVERPVRARLRDKLGTLATA